MNEINEAYDRITNPEKYTRQQPSGGSRNPYSGAGNSQGDYGRGSYHQGGYGYGERPDGAPYGAGRGWNTTDREGDGPYGWAGGFDFEDLFGATWASMNPDTIHPEASVNDSPEIKRAVNCINAKVYKQAIDTLSEIPSLGRNGRWYYLSALAHNGAGNTLTALEHIQRAVKLEPDNKDYQIALQALRQSGVNYQQESRQRGFTISPVNPGMICCGLCIAQYMARLFCYGF
jgi:molecular chaperone DnaJ